MVSTLPFFHLHESCHLVQRVEWKFVSNSQILKARVTYVLLKFFPASLSRACQTAAKALRPWVGGRLPSHCSSWTGASDRLVATWFRQVLLRCQTQMQTNIMKKTSSVTLEQDIFGKFPSTRIIPWFCWYPVNYDLCQLCLTSINQEGYPSV